MRKLIPFFAAAAVAFGTLAALPSAAAAQPGPASLGLELPVAAAPLQATPVHWGYGGGYGGSYGGGYGGGYYAPPPPPPPWYGRPHYRGYHGGGYAPPPYAYAPPPRWGGGGGGGGGWYR